MDYGRVYHGVGHFQFAFRCLFCGLFGVLFPIFFFRHGFHVRTLFFRVQGVQGYRIASLYVNRVQGLPRRVLYFFSLTVFYLLYLSNVPRARSRQLLLVFFRASLAYPSNVHLISGHRGGSTLITRPYTNGPYDLLRFFVFGPRPLL